MNGRLRTAIPQFTGAAPFVLLWAADRARSSKHLAEYTTEMLRTTRPTPNIRWTAVAFAATRLSRHFGQSPHRLELKEVRALMWCRSFCGIDSNPSRLEASGKLGTA